MEFRQTPSGCIIEVSVKPGSSESGVFRKGERVFVHLRNPPEMGRANAELVKLLEGALGREVSIISGRKSKRKSILIKSVDIEWIKTRLNI